LTTLGPDQAAFVYVGAFVDELARGGVNHVCVCPGSRSTPLALTIANHPSLRTWMHIDERSAAFFALGMARALDEPVALVCTSGTAAANFLPAVVEARIAGVPLLVLTADRPPELRDIGAAQTIDQNRLYGAHAKWFVEVALPDATPSLLRYARTLAARAISTAATTPAGPVHLNFPFREPLVPTAVDVPEGLSEQDTLAWTGKSDDAPWVTVADPIYAVSHQAVEFLAERFRNSERPLIVCGPQHDGELAQPLGELAASIGVPLLADPLSQLRWGPHDRSSLIDRYDGMLRHEGTVTALEPDLVLRIGGVPTSKALGQFLQRHSSAYHVVVDAAQWPDPLMLADEMIHSDPRHLCEMLHATLGNAGESPRRSRWFSRWKEADSATCRALQQYSESLSEPFEGRSLADVAACLPDRATIVVSSSMPVRDLDAFASGDDRNIRVLSNRGANGIDGVVSTALGVAAAAAAGNGGPVVLVIGDLAMYHDMNGLMAARLHSLDATIVVINNDGGGIFSFLPQAAEASHFEELWGTPHGLSFAPVAGMYGAEYHEASDSDSLKRSVMAGIAGSGLHIVEQRTDRQRNVELHREAWAAVFTELDKL
jgi:2-succinyl-5-enolpyruvyl-6-hydroxy-3-cyclohexene-1-carboxylate synthase